MEKIRVQKFLSDAGFCSRRAAENLIFQQKILVDEKIVEIGDKIFGSEKISIDGKIFVPQKIPKIVLAFHKPRGVESTCAKIRGQKTLTNFDFAVKISEKIWRPRFFPIGRLDKNSRGLLFLTNDGALGNFLCHPKFSHEKKYFVETDREISEKILEKFRAGKIILREKTGQKKIRKCECGKISAKKFWIILREGRNRQIRKMCRSCGLEVVDLCREKIGNFSLKNLPAGSFRILSRAEIANLRENFAK